VQFFFRVLAETRRKVLLLLDIHVHESEARLIEMRMNGMKAMVLSLLALTGGVFGVFLYRKVHAAVLQANKKQTDDALVDAMSEQSFPASDAPAY
jgi:hypothetical protein